MQAQEKSEFLAAYTKVLTNAWSSSQYATQLTTRPKETLAEAGLTIPADGNISIVRDVAGEASLEDQIAAWEKAASTNDFVLYVPETPMVDTAELSESDLEAVAGGTDYCCCCCPCCSCT